MQPQPLVLAALLLALAAATASADKCAVCGRLAEAFEAGIRRTAKDNFGGGNTHWEESRLGSYAHSETRLVDIQERLCDSEGKDDAAICHALLEQFEEAIESWWFGDFKSNPTVAGAAAAVTLRDLLCVRRGALCCPPGAFGPACAACPACAPGGGSCDGNGTRSGSGRCQCQPGYRGDLCAECAAGFFPGSQPAAAGAAAAACLACHPACGPAGCRGGAGPENCRSDCAPGYAPSQQADPPATVPEDASVTCLDVDECAVAAPAACAGPNERCVNSPGSFACDCEPGHRRPDAGGGVGCVPMETGEKSAETDGKSAETDGKSAETDGKSTEAIETEDNIEKSGGGESPFAEEGDVTEATTDQRTVDEASVDKDEL